MSDLEFEYFELLYQCNNSIQYCGTSGLCIIDV